MSGGARPQPSILRIIRGDPHKDRVRDDKPKFASPPQMPPGTVLSVAEHQMWEWLLEHVYVPGLHASGDGAAFVKVARLWARVQEADEKVRELGLTYQGSKLLPLTRLSRDLWQQLGVALADIGATPSGRVKLAAPKDGEDGGSWSDIE